MSAPLDLSFPVVLGTGGFEVDRPEAAAGAIETYLETGGRILDTARIYGTSEDAIGGWLRAHGDVPGLQLLTKGAHPDLDSWRPRLGRDDVLADARESVRLLGRPVELYLLHRDDPATPVDEIAATLRAVVDEGLTVGVGVSNWEIDRTLTLRAALADLGLPLGAISDYFGLAITSEAPDFPGVRSLDAATLAWVEEAAVPQLSWSSQSGGYFAGIARRQFPGAENERRRAELDRVAGVAGVAPASVLARWSATVSPWVVPIIASRSPERLRKHVTDAVDPALDAVVDNLIRAVDPAGVLGRALIPGTAAW